MPVRPHRIACAALVFMLLADPRAARAEGDDASKRLTAALDAVKAIYHEEDAARAFTPGRTIRRLEAEGRFTGEKGAEIRAESLRLARKLFLRKRPDVPPGALLSAALTIAESEPNDTFATADPVVCNATVTGSVTPAGDVDWFSFSLATAQLVDITVSCDGDSTMTLWSGETSVVEFDDDDGPGLCSKITRVLAPGNYAVELNEFGDDGTIAYSIALTCTEPPDPEVEPNDTLGTAQPTACGRAVEGQISPAGDADWFTLTLDSTYRLTLDVDCNGDSTLALRNASGALIEFDDDDGVEFCSSITRTLQAGTYKIEVREFGDNGVIAYTLRILCAPLGGDETEPNDAFGQADPLACDDSLAARVDPAGDVDAWAFSLPEGTDLTIDVACDGGDPVLALFDGVGSPIGFGAAGGGSCSRLALHLPAGNYFATVSEPLGATLGYTIVLSCLPAVDETEPNDEIPAADPVACDAPMTGRVHPLGDVDLFRLDLEAQLDVTIDVPCDGDARLRVLDAAGSEIAADDDSGEGLCPRLSIRLDPGTHFVEIRANGPQETVEYTLDVSCAPPFPPESEPNDDIASASPLPCGETRQGTIFPAGDADFWKLTLAARSLVTASVECLGRDTTLSVQNAAGTEVAFDDDSGPGLCPEIAIILESGDWYLVVREEGGDAIAPYRIVAACVPLPPIDETEPNDDVATADPIACGETLRAVVDSASDVDVFVFSLSDLATATVSVSTPDSGLDPVLCFRDASTLRLLRTVDDTVGDDPSMTMTLPAGTYAAEVRGLSGTGLFAAYEVAVSCTSPSIVAAGCTDDGHSRLANLSPSGSVVEWLYNGRAGESVRIVGKSSSFDPHLVLVGPDGALVDVDDDDADGFGSQICVALAQDGPHRVLLEAVEGGTGQCGVEFDLVRPPNAAESEPNDTPAEAQTLVHLDHVLGTRSSALDDDVYVFNAAENDVVSIDVRTCVGADNTPLPGTDLTLELTTSDGTSVAFSDNEGLDTDPIILANLPSSPDGTYFARVSGATAGDYELFFRFDQFPVTIVPLVPPKVAPGTPITARVSGKNLSPVEKRITYTADRIDELGSSTRLRTRMARARVGLEKTVTVSLGSAPGVAAPTRFRYVSTVLVGTTAVTVDFDVVVVP